MKQSRRTFLKNTSLFAAALPLSRFQLLVDNGSVEQSGGSYRLTDWDEFRLR